MLAAPTGLTAAGNLDDMDLDAELDQLMDMDEEEEPALQQRRTASTVAAQDRPHPVAKSRETVVLPVNSMREERETQEAAW